MDKIVSEQISGELLREGISPVRVLLNVKVKEIQPDESTTPIKRILVSVALSPMSGIVIEDGVYPLRFSFDGQQTETTYRVQGGKLYAA